MVVCGVILSPAPGLLPDSQDWYSTTHFILQDVSSCSVVAVSWWCLLAQAGQPLRQHHPLARGGSASDRHPGVDHRLHLDQVIPTVVYNWSLHCSVPLGISCREMLVIMWELGGWLRATTSHSGRLSWGWAGPNTTNITQDLKYCQNRQYYGVEYTNILLIALQYIKYTIHIK